MTVSIYGDILYLHRYNVYLVCFHTKLGKVFHQNNFKLLQVPLTNLLKRGSLDARERKIKISGRKQSWRFRSGFSVRRPWRHIKKEREQG